MYSGGELLGWIMETPQMVCRVPAAAVVKPQAGAEGTIPAVDEWREDDSANEQLLFED